MRLHLDLNNHDKTDAAHSSDFNSLKQKNIENYNKAGKIYVPLFEKVIQTFLSIFDFVKLLFVKDLSYDNHSNHNILEQEINLNERI